MANMQHPIICPPVFGKEIRQPIIQLTSSWLLGEIKHFDKRVHTPSLGYGHYPTTYEVVSLFVSVFEETLREAPTGGKGSITQWVHAEYMEGSETICPAFTQWVRGGYFSKVPTKVPTG